MISILTAFTPAPAAQASSGAAPSSGTEGQEGGFLSLLTDRLADPAATAATATTQEAPPPRPHEGAAPDPAAGIAPPPPQVTAPPLLNAAQPAPGAPGLAAAVELDERTAEEIQAEAQAEIQSETQASLLQTTPATLGFIWPAPAPSTPITPVVATSAPLPPAAGPARDTPAGTAEATPPGQPALAMTEAAPAPASSASDPRAGEEQALATPAEARQGLPPLPPSKADATTPTFASAIRDLAAPALSSQQTAAAATSFIRPPDLFTRTVPVPTQVSIEAPVRSPEFQAEFADKVVWVAGRKEQWAELSLNPANMGTVEIRLSMTEEGAGAQFFSPHAQVREALEAAMPRLREMLSQAGIVLQDASVRDQSLPRRDSSEGQSGRPPGDPRNPGDDQPRRDVSLPSHRPRTGVGLVDYYA